MRRRAGVAVLLVVVFAAGLAVAAIQAGSSAIFATTVAPTAPATTGATTAAPTVETTTAPATTVATTTAPALPPNVGVVGATTARLSKECLSVGAFALLEPGRAPLVVGPLADPPRVEDDASAAIAYPADGSVLTAHATNVQTNGCPKADAANGHASTRGASLFGGAIEVGGAALSVRHGTLAGGPTMDGLVVDGRSVAPWAGRKIPVADWAYAVAGDASVSPLSEAALSVHLTAPHAGLPAGTVLLVSFAALPQASPPVVTTQTQKARPAAKQRTATTRDAPPSATTQAKTVASSKPQQTKKRLRKEKRKQRRGAPLKATPALDAGPYAFPVAGPVADYVDTYGAFRGDVPGDWHHGDDIFAPVGTPVVAVADGTLNRVGWERIGGWRLWVRDRRRNEFYYAHLSGYSPLAMRSKRVKKGDVIGFIGNTGDAFTTSPHLHFEVHPVSFLPFGYNGAVDPTTYLESWSHIARVRAPRPVHPAFPGGAVRAEARYVWRELLAARGLSAQAPSPSERPRVSVPEVDRTTSPAAAPAPTAATPTSGTRATAAAIRPVGVGGRQDGWVGVLTPVAGTALLAGAALVLRPRRRSGESDV